MVPCLRWCFLSTVSIAKPRLEPQLQLKVTVGMNFKQGFSLETPTLWLKGGTVR